MNYQPQKTKCFGCKRNGSKLCGSLRFDMMPKHRTDGFDTIVICTAYDRNEEQEVIIPFEWTQHKLDLLGTMTDVRFAREHGLERRQVLAKRKSMGIPPAPRISLPPDIIEQLGLISDRELAEKAGVSTKVVKSRRQLAGIRASKLNKLDAKA